MVKAAKYLVLVAGLMGLVAFFLPMVTAEHQGQKISASAFQAVRGVSIGEEKLDEASKTQAAATPEGQKAVSDMGDFLTKVKAFLYGVYAPALLLTLFGLIGVLKKKFGRGFGVLSVLLALVVLGLWALFFMAQGEVNKDATEGKIALGLGIHLLLGTGILAFIGGITNTVKPDYGFG
jgi:hypothetical protein